MRLRVSLSALLALSLLLTVLLAALLPGLVLADSHTDQQRIDDSKSRFSLGRMYEQAGDLTRAEQYYQQAVEIWPENQEARLALQKLIDSRKPPEPTTPFWVKWLSWLPGLGDGTNYATGIMELFGWIIGIVLFIALFFKFGMETIRLAILRSKGIPLLGLGTFNDLTGRVPGLPHQLATNMNDAGLTFYDEKGAVPPDFNFVGEVGIPQARLLAKMLELVYVRMVQRINVDLSMDGGVLNAAVSLSDSGNGYVRYLQVVSINPDDYPGGGEVTRVVAQLIADAVLIALSKDPNTRGLLYQRMGDWQSALKEFISAAEAARKKGICHSYHQAHLNLGNLYSFLGLQDKSVDAYNEVVDKVTSPATVALIQAAMACSYKNWELGSPPEHQGTYAWLARQAMDKALSTPDAPPLVAYTISCYYSLGGQIEECLRWLREAVAGDLTYLEYAMTDPDMENLRRWLNGGSLGEALGLRV